MTSDKGGAWTGNLQTGRVRGSLHRRYGRALNRSTGFVAAEATWRGSSFPIREGLCVAGLKENGQGERRKRNDRLQIIKCLPQSQPPGLPFCNHPTSCLNRSLLPQWKNCVTSVPELIAAADNMGQGRKLKWASGLKCGQESSPL